MAKEFSDICKINPKREASHPQEDFVLENFKDRVKYILVDIGGLSIHKDSPIWESVIKFWNKNKES